jgi:hypothetical protein
LPHSQGDNLATWQPGGAVTTVTRQLAFELTPAKVEGLLDLNFHDHEQRLDALDGVDFLPAPAPKCGCEPHGLHATDEHGTAVCWSCGREVAGDDTPRQGALSGDGLRSDRSGEAR